MKLPQLIFERSEPGRQGTAVRARTDCNERVDLPESLLRENGLPLPEVSELELTRHYVRLSQKTFGVDTGFYPLGSCTMKYNPKATEAVAGRTAFAHVHPAQPPHTLQGFMELLYNLQDWLADITGMDAISLQPAAGAQGEFAGMLMFRRYFEGQGDTARDVMIVPDSAHGTNPASAVLAGFKVAEVKCADHGGIMSMELLEEVIAKHGADHVAGIMLTNPSTLGLYEEHIVDVATRLHDIGAQLYYDGANLNALLGISRPGDMGFDLVHLNTHKTFSTPHGGGGPGAGPIGVKAHLADYLPAPRIGKDGDQFVYADPPKTIGRVKLYAGQFLVLVRAWAYILLHGPEGLRRIADYSILNANYVQEKLKGAYEVPYGDRHCMHEFVASAAGFKDTDIHAKDIAKALLNAGFHAPTMYFPLIVDEALMVEPTETESLETLDAFCEVMLKFARLARENPEELRRLDNLEVRRLDETHAARNLNVRWTPSEEGAAGAE
jgi:glycine dehydrogenase subunit 2